jgi:hypothetical protein
MITIANHFPTHRMFNDNGTSPVAPVRACLRLAFGDAPLPITVVWAPALVSFAGIIDAVAAGHSLKMQACGVIFERFLTARLPMVGRRLAKSSRRLCCSMQ